jgi:hypothetical protein
MGVDGFAFCTIPAPNRNAVAETPPQDFLPSSQGSQAYRD